MRNHAPADRHIWYALATLPETNGIFDRHPETRFAVKSLTLVLIVCAATAAQSATAQDRMAAIRTGCAADAQKLCPGVPSGGGRIIACLAQHKDSLSDRCKQAAGLPVGPAANSAANPGNPAPNNNAAPSPASSAANPPAAPASAPSSPAPPPRPSAAAPSSSTAKGAPSGYLLLKQVQLIAHVSDPALGPGTSSVPALDMLIPSTWTLKGGATGNTTEGCYADFFATAWDAESPDSSLAFQGAPSDSWQYADDPAELRKMTDPQRRAPGAGGKPCPVKKPMKAEDYLRQNIFPVMPGGTLISIEPFPALNEIARRQLGLPPAAAGNAGGPQVDAVRARVQFQKDGKDLETWLAVAVVTRVFPQGRGSLYDCHAIDIMAFRAPKGQLDPNEKLFNVMIGSIQPEPKWQAYSGQFIAKLYQMEAQKEATIDAVVANFQNQVAQTIMGVVANQQQGGFNSNFGEDQIIRGVQTFRDPTTGGTMELSNLYDQAWSNGSNEYLMSDDPNFNPNGHLNGSWNQLQLVHPAP